MSIKGSVVRQGGHAWEVVSTARTATGWRIVLKAKDDPECRILARTPPGAQPMRASELTDALRVPECRWFRDPTGALWRVETEGTPGPVAAWLTFVSDRGGQRIRVRNAEPGGVACLTDEDLFRMVYDARRAGH